jgi:putative oxidoreductase
MGTDIRAAMRTSYSNDSDWSLLMTRLFLGVVIAAHGAQKLFGWFGGFGFEGTMNFFSQDVGLPYIAGLLIILEESFGMLALMAGMFTRVCATGMIVIMLGAMITTHLEHGFFMNWFGNQTGEGYEFDLLVIALSLQLVIRGAGAYSVDTVLVARFQNRPQIAKFI